MQWENDPLYRLIRTIKNVMDRYYLDPLIGLLFPTAGDIFSSAMTLPFLTVSLFKIKSIPLTLAILYNMLVDMMLGIIPLWIGDLLDIFSRSYAKNYRLTGYLPDHDTLGMDKRTVLSIPENTYLYAKIIHNGKKRIHAGQQGLAGRKGKGRGSDAAPEGYLLQGAGIGQE